ncbi:MAG: ATPase, partial [Tissierellia bacterium]|nr:ATPase [Tissierellia bacterium]
MDNANRIAQLEDLFIKKRVTHLARMKEKDFYISQLNTLNESIEDEEKEILKLEKVVVLLKKTAEYTREQAKKQIENLVSGCLKFIFEEDIKFEIEFKGADTGTGSNRADFYVITDYNGYNVKTDPATSRGGGVVDIVGLALRVAFIQTSQPVSEGLLILDEPAKHVSVEYINRVSDFIKKTSDTFNRQIIMITH